MQDTKQIGVDSKAVEAVQEIQSPKSKRRTDSWANKEHKVQVYKNWGKVDDSTYKMRS